MTENWSSQAPWAHKPILLEQLLLLLRLTVVHDWAEQDWAEQAHRRPEGEAAQKLTRLPGICRQGSLFFGKIFFHGVVFRGDAMWLELPMAKCH